MVSATEPFEDGEETGLGCLQFLVFDGIIGMGGDACRKERSARAGLLRQDTFGSVSSYIAGKQKCTLPR